MPKLSKIFSIKYILAITLILFTGFGCRKNVSIESVKPITLEYWQVWNSSFDVQPLIDEYEKRYPNIKIHFRNLRFEEYEQEMLKALAEDSGPDIFSIPHDWVGLYRNIIYPEPKTVAIKRVIIQEPRPGELEPTVSNVLTETKTLIDANTIRRGYYSFVKDDVLERSESEGAAGNRINEEQVLALPLAIDILGLYYNTTLLEKNEIFNPPATWQKFQEDVIKIAKVDKNNTILTAGAALGTARNVIRPTDILAALMIQTGVEMINKDQSYATFHQNLREQDKYNGGLEALRFYTDFADPTKKVYTWNSKQGSALEQFKQGTVAYMLGYGYNLTEIKNSKVRFGVGPIPVPEGAIGPTTVANYWVETVSKKSEHKDEAWHFLNFLSEPSNLLQIQASGKISPLKEHSGTITNQELAVFAAQAPHAVVWYAGKNAPLAEEAMLTMIDDTVSGKSGLEDALSFGAQKVSETL